MSLEEGNVSVVEVFVVKERYATGGFVLKATQAESKAGAQLAKYSRSLRRKPVKKFGYLGARKIT